MSFALKTENFLLWQENKDLKIEDFRAQVKDTLKTGNHKFLGAISAISIEYYSYQRSKFSVPDFTIKTYFDKDNSWMLVKNSYVLQHEQIHFDISELYARKMRKSVESLRQKGVIKLEPYRKKISFWNRMKDKTSDQFDADNDDYYMKIGNKILFRKNPKQEEWKSKIDKELYIYQLFANKNP